ncbi:DUF167 domain-containing protein [bacterium]|nr:MAG: DUF167 domain-containing protein [bacterium]
MSTRITVKVKPRASVDAIEGWMGDVLVVRLTSPPVDGAANKALLKLISKKMRIAKTRVRIVSGERSREKILEIEGLSLQETKKGLS